MNNRAVFGIISGILQTICLFCLITNSLSAQDVQSSPETKFQEIVCPYDSVPAEGQYCTDSNGDPVNCTICERCGDGILLPGSNQTCEPSQGLVGNCRDDCTYCGDGIVNHGSESCDGADMPGSGAYLNPICQSNCTYAYCGDGIANTPSEECDISDFSQDPNAGSYPAGATLKCNLSCEVEAYWCGDGVFSPELEQCDASAPDGGGNIVNGCNNCTRAPVNIVLEKQFRPANGRFGWTGQQFAGHCGDQAGKRYIIEGEDVEYRISVTNNSIFPLTDYELTDPLLGYTQTFDINDGETIVFPVGGPIPRDGLPASGTPYQNTAIVLDGPSGVGAPIISDTTEFCVVGAAFTITKSVTGNRTGHTITNSTPRYNLTDYDVWYARKNSHYFVPSEGLSFQYQVTNNSIYPVTLMVEDQIGGYGPQEHSIGVGATITINHTPDPPLVATPPRHISDATAKRYINGLLVDTARAEVDVIIPEGLCPNGYFDGDPEQCDDGNLVDNDECTNGCQLPTCGDGIVQDNRENACGPGETPDEDYCVYNEECDDANNVDDDFCTNSCFLPACGDGILQPHNIVSPPTGGEECDFGADNGNPSVIVEASAVLEEILADDTWEDIEYVERIQNDSQAIQDYINSLDFSARGVGNYSCSVNCERVPANPPSECLWVGGWRNWGGRMQGLGTKYNIADLGFATMGMVRPEDEQALPSCFMDRMNVFCGGGVSYSTKSGGASFQLTVECGSADALSVNGIMLGSTHQYINPPPGGPADPYAQYERVDWAYDADCNAIYDWRNYKVCGFGGISWSPISLLWEDDIDINLDNTMVEFPLNPNDPAKYTVWKGSDVAPLLVYDPQQTGEVKDARQLFGSWTFGGRQDSLVQLSSISGGNPSESWNNGYEALGMLDLDRSQAIEGSELQDIYLWFDKNRNAKVDDGELRSAVSEGIKALYYTNPKVIEGEDVGLRIGYTREVNGQVKTGSSIDWFGKSYDTEHDAFNALKFIYSSNSNKAKSVSDNQIGDQDDSLLAKPNASRLNYEEFISEIIFNPAENRQENSTGFWIWELERNKNAKAGEEIILPGMFAIKEYSDGTVRGFSITEAPLEENSGGIRSWVNTYELFGEYTVDQSGRKILNFTINDLETQSFSTSKALIEADGKQMRGVTTQEFRSDVVQEVVDGFKLNYKWYATKFY